MLVIRAQKFIRVSSFIFHSAFLCQLHALSPLQRVRIAQMLFSTKGIVYTFLNKTLFEFVGSLSLPSFMIVNDAVSEIRELNQNKEKKKRNSEIPI